MFLFLVPLWMCLLLQQVPPNQYKSSSSRASVNVNTAPIPIISTANNNVSHIGSLKSPTSAPETSQGSMDVGDVLEQPSAHCTFTRIKLLQQCASAISELVHEKVKGGRQLEAFSIQLVILAIWKQALHICHTQAAWAIEGSPSQESMRLRRCNNKKVGTPDSEDCTDAVPEYVSTQMEKEFLQEVEHAEELAKTVEPAILRCLMQWKQYFNLPLLWEDMEELRS